MILANPPFAKKGCYTIVGEDGKITTKKQKYERDELRQSRYPSLPSGRDYRSRLRAFWATTSNPEAAGLTSSSTSSANFRLAAAKGPWTEDLWINDLGTNQHFTLKTNLLKEADLVGFVKCYGSGTGGTPALLDREETDRFEKFPYDEIVARDKANPRTRLRKRDQPADP